MTVTDIRTGASDGYLGYWEACEPVKPDMSVIGGRPPKEKDTNSARAAQKE